MFLMNVFWNCNIFSPENFIYGNFLPLISRVDQQSYGQGRRNVIGIQRIKNRNSCIAYINDIVFLFLFNQEYFLDFLFLFNQEYFLTSAVLRVASGNKHHSISFFIFLNLFCICKFYLSCISSLTGTIGTL